MVNINKMQTVIVYHGGPRLINKSGGYIAKNKKGRQEFGVGLYTTFDHYQAVRYGRCVSEMELELDPTKDAINVFVSFKQVLMRLAWFASKAACKRIQEAFNRYSQSDNISLQHFVSLVVNYDPKIHLYSSELNSLLLEFGAQYTTEIGFNKMILIHDFSIIKTIKKG